MYGGNYLRTMHDGHTAEECDRQTWEARSTTPPLQRHETRPRHRNRGMQVFSRSKCRSFRRAESFTHSQVPTWGWRVGSSAGLSGAEVSAEGMPARRLLPRRRTEVLTS